MRRPNPPQSSDQIKAKVTSMREATDKEIDRVRSELVRLENLVREGEMLAAAVVDRYEDTTNRVRNSMADLFSTGIGELAAVMQSANEQARRHLEERVSPDTEAPRFEDRFSPGELVKKDDPRLRPGDWESLGMEPRAKLGEDRSPDWIDGATGGGNP